MCGRPIWSSQPLRTKKGLFGCPALRTWELSAGVAASHENIEAEGIFALISHEGDVSTRGNYLHRLPCRLRNCEEGDISALLVIWLNIYMPSPVNHNTQGHSLHSCSE